MGMLLAACFALERLPPKETEDPMFGAGFQYWNGCAGGVVWNSCRGERGFGQDLEPIAKCLFIGSFDYFVGTSN